MRFVRNLVDRYGKDHWGNMTLGFALATPALLCALGIAIDYGYYAMMKTRLQAAADSAVIAGASEMSIADVTDQQIKGAVSSAVATGKFDDYGVTTITTGVDVKTNAVNSTVALAWKPFLADLFDVGITPIVVDAEAHLVSQSYNVCVLSLKKSGGEGISASSTARLQADDCGVFANSDAANAITAKNSAKIIAGGIFTSGGYTHDNGAVLSPTPITDTSTVNDPLAGRAPPAVGGCDQTGYKASNGIVTLSPGVYCGGIHLSGQAVATFEPGIYIMKDGPLLLTGKASVQGESVGFYFDGVDSVVDFKNNAVVSFAGPKDGDMAGILFFGQRSADLTRVHKIDATDVTRLEGTIYFPSATLEVTPKASNVAQDSAYTAIIVYQLKLAQSPSLVVNSDYGNSDVPVPEGIVRSGTVVLSE